MAISAISNDTPSSVPFLRFIVQVNWYTLYLSFSSSLYFVSLLQVLQRPLRQKLQTTTALLTYLVEQSSPLTVSQQPFSLLPLPSPLPFPQIYFSFLSSLQTRFRKNSFPQIIGCDQNPKPKIPTSFSFPFLTNILKLHSSQFILVFR